MSDTVNLASRLQSMSKYFDHDILLSTATAASLGPEFKLRPLPITMVKGKSKPVQVLALD